MRVQTGLVLLLCWLSCGGCGGRSTDELIAGLKSSKGGEATIAAPPCRWATRKRSFRR